MSFARNVEAEAALRGATRADPTFAEAWYNLSDCLTSRGAWKRPLNACGKQLQIVPDYSDAIFNIALLLQRKNNMRRLRIIGADISPTIPDPNGLGGLAVH